MNPEYFSEWHRRQGHKVIHTSSSYWYEAFPGVFQAFPYHWLITPSKEELRLLTLKHGALALRYSTPMDVPFGKVSYHIFLSGPYGLDKIRSKTRRTIKQGLEQFSVEPISFKRMAEEGWELQDDTLQRQQRTECMAQECWEEMCLTADGIPGFEAWGSIINGELAASLLIARIGDTYNTLYSMSRSKYMNMHANHTLFFSVSCELLKREGVNSIFYTVQSLDAPASVDVFKFRMGFQPRPVRQMIVFHPFLQPFVGKGLHRLLSHLFARNPNSYLLAKAEGMVRFYLDGRLPIYNQEFPECLEKLPEPTQHDLAVRPEIQSPINQPDLPEKQSNFINTSHQDLSEVQF